MGLDDQDLSADERRLVAELHSLAPDPSPERRAKIMAAVRAAQPSTRRLIGPWRPVLAGLVAAVILMATAVGAVASAGDAVPSSPNYSLRALGEQVRLSLSDPTTREHLRIAFAKSRIAQAQKILDTGDVSNAKGLLKDSQQYLAQARKEVANLPPSEQGEIENELDQADAQEHETESRLEQEGE